MITKKFSITTDFDQSFVSEKTPPTEYLEEIFNNKSFSIDTSNKYFVYTEEFYHIITSNESIPIIIDFCNEKNLFIKTKDNKPINSSLYSIEIVMKTLIGNFTAIIDGEEKILDFSQRIYGVSKFNYYPYFSKNSYIIVFTYQFYLKNNTSASYPTNYNIIVCKINCTCNCYRSQKRNI